MITITNPYVTTVTNRYPVLGGDISKWQGTCNFKRMSEWAQFLFIRAGYGNRGYGSDDSRAVQTDTRFRENWMGSKTNKIPRGAYWYFVPEIDPVMQANHFVQLLTPDRGELPPMLDIEENKQGLSAQEIRRRMNRFMSIVDARTGHRCGVYTSYGFVTSHMSYNLGIVMAGRMKWCASWKRLQPLTPPGWADWDFWQFSADGNGLGRYLGASGSSAIDLDVWNGDQKSFAKEFNLEIEDEGTPLPTILPKKVIPLTTIRIREKPSTRSAIKGRVSPNSKWTPLEIALNSANREQWVKIADDAWIAYWLCRRQF